MVNVELSDEWKADIEWAIELCLQDCYIADPERRERIKEILNYLKHYTE